MKQRQCIALKYAGFLTILIGGLEVTALPSESLTITNNMWIRVQGYVPGVSGCTPVGTHTQFAGQSFDGQHTQDGGSCVPVYCAAYSQFDLPGTVFSSEQVYYGAGWMDPGPFGGTLCCPLTVNWGGVPSCITAIFSNDWPPGNAPGEGGCYVFPKPTRMSFNLELQRNTNSLPCAKWSIKNQSGVMESFEPTDGHYSLPADGMSQAIATVINTTDTPTFVFTGGSNGCSLTANGVLTAGTNFGTVQVTALLTNDNNVCLVRDFFFDLESCSSCAGQCDSAGIGSVDVRFGLGPSRKGAGDAFLQIKSTVPSASLGTPQSLRCDFTRPEFERTTNADGSLRQFRALDRVVDIVTNSATSYSLYFYGLENLLPRVNGLYQFTNSPFKTVTIQLVGGDTNHFQVNNSAEPAAADYYWETNGWALVTGGGIRRETKTSSQAGQVRTDIRTIKNAQGVIESWSYEKWQTFSFGDRLIEEVSGTGGGARTNGYSYNTNNGLLAQVTRGDGSWEIYQYDSMNRQTERYRPFLNAAPTTNAASSRRTSSTYTNSVVSGSGDDWTLESYTPRRVIEYATNNVEVSRRYTVVQSGMRIEIQCVESGAAWTNANNLFTTNYLRTDAVYFGKPWKTVRPDGTMELQIFWDKKALPETLQTIGPPTYTKTIAWIGAPSSDYGSVVSGTRIDTWIDKSGHTLLEIRTNIASGIMISSNRFYYDLRGHLTNTVYLDGTKLVQNYDCCDLTSTIDNDGTVTSYTYDGLKRLLTTTRAGVTTSNVYDSVGNVLGTVRYGSDGSSITTGHTAYNDGGEQVSSTDALNNTTTYTNYLDGSSQFIRKTTYPDQTTRIETYARDGSLLKTTGTALRGVRYDYGVQSDGGFQRSYIKEIKLDASDGDTSEWTKSLTDGAGRAYKVVFADTTSGSETDNPYNQSFFNNKGQLWKQRDPDGVTTLFQYNTRGEQEYTALDLNTNGVIDFGGSDRITFTTNDVIANYGTFVRRARTYVWSTASSSTSNLNSVAETSRDGLRSWQTIYRDASTPVVSSNRTVYAGNGVRYETNTAPDGSFTISAYQNGRLNSVIRKDSGGNQISAATMQYDPHGRQSQMVDARTGATIYGYNDADLVTSVTTPTPGTGQSAQTSYSFYNSRLQVTNSVAADGASTTYEFYPSGELKRTYGGRNYPVGYSYDYAGRVKTMTNWTSFASAGARVTTWNYDLYRGWLTNKTYDAGATGPNYSYTAGGRLLTRTWARIGSQNKRIVTTYTYGFNDDTGGNEHPDLLKVKYTQDPQSTPEANYTYDRRGRRATCVRDISTTTYTYNDVDQALSESYSGGTLGGLAVTNLYDPFLRRATNNAWNGATKLAESLYGYDAASRLQTVGDGTSTAAYAYLANSPLVEKTYFTNNGTLRMTTTKRYDFLNRLLAIQSSAGATPVASYNYQNNDANQRVKVYLADGSFWIYEYDSLGQVKSGKRYWPDWTPVAGQQFEYTHDDIGNRTATKAGGDENGMNLRSATFAANNLNQYTNRTVPGAVDVMGVAYATNTVTVNGVSTYRRGEYFRREVPTNNASVPVWAGISVSSASSNVTGNVFVPKTPELFTYDADGNLLTDGRWIYIWDAENRLLELGVNTGGVGPQQYLRFEYDCQGRRIGKKIWNNANGSGQPATTLKFVYDGWNLVAVLNGSSVLQQSFIWGLDLSGSEQGAGGVGGLLAIKDIANGAHFALFDGNGNVTTLVSVTNAAVTARYEYGPFGETVRASGAMAKVNPFRFSTKYQDDESDFLYYGYRFLSVASGRWLSRDPIDERGGLSLYALVGNDTIGQIDPFGLVEFLERVAQSPKASATSPSSSSWYLNLLQLVMRARGYEVKHQAVLYGIAWVTGFGPEAMWFNQRDQMVQEIVSHSGVEAARARVKAELRRRSAQSGEVGDFDFSRGVDNYSLGGWMGALLFIRDYSFIITGGTLGGTPTATFLGSYELRPENGRVIVSKVNRANCSAEVYFRIFNETGLESGTHFPVLGYVKSVFGIPVASLQDIMLGNAPSPAIPGGILNNRPYPGWFSTRQQYLHWGEKIQY